MMMGFDLTCATNTKEHGMNLMSQRARVERERLFGQRTELRLGDAVLSGCRRCKYRSCLRIFLLGCEHKVLKKYTATTITKRGRA
jgi:hypothetical protein